MIIGILAFIVFIVTTALYTVLGNMYHMKTDLTCIFFASVFTSGAFSLVCILAGS